MVIPSKPESWQPRHNLLSRGVADRRAWFDCLDQFDDEHAPVVAGGAFGQRSAGDFFVAVAIIGGGIAGRRLGLWHGEKLTATGKLLLSAAIAKEAVITDAMEAIGEDVEEEATDELVGGQRHRGGRGGGSDG